MSRHDVLVLAAGMLLVAGCGELPTESGLLGSDLLNASADGTPVVGYARGSGHAECGPNSVFTCVPPGPLRTFSFTAQVFADGSVGGRAQTKNRTNGNEVRASVQCVNFFGVNQNRAWMIATVTHSNTATFPIGSAIEFAVADNGEGTAAGPDQIMGFGAANPNIVAAICSGGFDNFLDFLFDNLVGFDIRNGDIQVQAP